MFHESVRMKLLLANLVLVFGTLRAEEADFLYDKFPDDFVWSGATSSYQIEGAWNIDGKGESIWDTFSHQGGNVHNNDTGDDACKSYEKYKEDVKLLKDMGVSTYRFSLSWPRILPNGTEPINQKGIDYYQGLIAELKNARIEPVITLYHWDLPQALEDLGGWLNDSMVDYFGDYARICYQTFGADVKYWVTPNEPWIIAWLGYGNGAKAPGIKDAPGTKPYIAGHVLIKAHARAYHIYHNDFYVSQKGSIGMSYNVGWQEPKTDSQADKDAAERALQFDMGWFANPTKYGDYPEIMKTKIQEKSTAQGLNKSRLPVFTDYEKAYIRNTNDYFGLNFYSGGYAENVSQGIHPISYETDKDVNGSSNDAWLGSGSSWLKVTPTFMRKILVWIKDTYGNPPLLITENGVSDRNGSLDDQHRIHYLKYYINNVLKAIKLDGCNVIGYTAWSLMDNFEWEQGYVERFGLHYVNFSDPERQRTPKESALYYKQIIKDNGFNKPDRPSGSSKGLSANTCSILLISFLCLLLTKIK